MSGLLNKLRDAAADEVSAAALKAIDDQGPEAVDDLLQDARTWATENLEGDSLAVGVVVLDNLADVKEPALRLGKVGVAMVVGLLESGAEQEAERFYYAHEATQAERDAWIDEQGDDAVDAAAEKAQAWEAFKRGVIKAGKQGLQILGTIILGAIGL